MSDDRRERLAELLRRRAGQGDAIHPLSHGQQALWFLHQLVPGTAAYNVVFGARVRSALDVPALERALRELLTRHPILRATFEPGEGRPGQRLRPVGAAPLDEVDARDLAPARLHEAVVEAAQRAFDLEAGPLVRLVLFTRAADDRVLVLAVHHLVVDGSSFGVLLDDLFQLYAAEVTGRARPPAAAPAQYRDFVRWQAEMLAVRARARGCGRTGDEALGGDLPVLDLPTDRPRPAVVGLRGASVGFALAAELTATAQAAGDGRAHDALRRATGGAAGAARPLHGPDGHPGRLAGRGPRARGPRAGGRQLHEHGRPPRRPGGDPSFRAFVARLRERVLGALTHQDYPFALLVEALKADRDPSRMPDLPGDLQLLRLQSATGMARPRREDDGAPVVEIGGLRLERWPLPQQEGQFDLDLEMMEIGSPLHGRLKYDTALFDAGTIDRMVGHFEPLLRGGRATPDRTLGELPLLSEAERHRLARRQPHQRVFATASTACTSCSRRRSRARPTPAAVVSGGER